MMKSRKPAEQKLSRKKSSRKKPPTEKTNLPGKPRVVALVYDGLCTFEYGIAAEVFGLHRQELGGALYHFSSVSLEAQPARAAGGLLVEATGEKDDLERANIIVIPGWRGKDEAVPEKMQQAVITAHQRGVCLLSICSGVYVLAAAGLLANRRVTTHWRYTEDLTDKFPEVIVQANALYVEDGEIITSAGSSAGIDACLHMVRSDYGSKVANTVARRLVMHAHRHGGQAQFIEQPLAKKGSTHTLSELMENVRGELDKTHSISSMAQAAQMNPRTFQRRFLALTGTPAMEWLGRERVSHSCLLLETTDLRVDEICQTVGFSNAETMRYHFRQQLCVSPMAYRKRFNGIAG